MHYVSLVTAPFVWLLTHTSDLLLRLMGIRSETDSIVTEEEIKSIVQESADSGQIDEIEGRMRFLSNRASFSTISVMLTARPVPLTVNPHPTPNSYQPLPDINLPFEVLEQLGLPRLLSVR